MQVALGLIESPAISVLPAVSCAKVKVQARQKLAGYTKSVVSIKPADAVEAMLAEYSRRKGLGRKYGCIFGKRSESEAVRNFRQGYERLDRQSLTWGAIYSNVADVLAEEMRHGGDPFAENARLGQRCLVELMRTCLREDADLLALVKETVLNVAFFDTPSPDMVKALSLAPFVTSDEFVALLSVV